MYAATDLKVIACSMQGNLNIRQEQTHDPVQVICSAESDDGRLPKYEKEVIERDWRGRDTVLSAVCV